MALYVHSPIGSVETICPHSGSGRTPFFGVLMFSVVK